MKKLLLTAALAVFFAAPSFAEDAVAPAADTTVTTEVTATGTVQEPAPTPAPADQPAAQANEEAKEACTSETNEKVKLPENAGDAEKAQWDAAFAECLKGKGVEPEATVDVDVDVKTDAPAAEATTEVKGDAAAE